ncbi:MAG: helix-turn-helix domain-containing protein [Patescibacteria group bacterium]|jgi:sugar-specific transcriptional regulator TrmB
MERLSEEIYKILGLSPNEWRIYETLLDKGESTVSRIATVGKIHRRNAYDAMRRLLDKGLCFQVLTPGETHYNAVDPDKLLELLTEKRQRLEDILPALKKKFHERRIDEEAYIYRGFEGLKNIWREVLRVGEDSYFIGAKGGWFDPRLTVSGKRFFQEAKKKKITFIHLFDQEVKIKLPNFAKEFPATLKYRYLPKKYSTASGIHIFGDYVITHTGFVGVGHIDEDVVFFVLKSKKLADSYRTWFWCIWDESND